MQVGDSIIQKLCLVSANAEFNVRIYTLKIIHGAANGLLHVIHIFVRLLDNGQCHCPFTIAHGYAFFPDGNNTYPAELFQTDDASIFVNKNILHILFRTQQSGKLDIVFIISITYGHTSRFHIILGKSRFYILYGKSQYGKLIFIGNNLQLALHQSCDIHHGYLCQLLDTPFDNAFGKFTQIEESTFVRLSVSAVILQGEAEIEYRNIGSTCFYYFRTVCILRQVVHGGVNLLIHFDKSKIRIGAEVEIQPDKTCPIMRLAIHIFQTSHLDKLLAQWFHHRILQLTRRSILCRDLYCNLRDGNIRQQRYRQREIRYHTDNKTCGKRHQYGNGPLYQELNHPFYFLFSITFTGAS